MAERKGLRDQLADDDRRQHQGNRHDSEGKDLCRSGTQIEAMLEERTDKLLRARTTDRSRQHAHEGNAHLDRRQRPLRRFAQTQKPPNSDIPGGSVGPDVGLRRRDEGHLQRRERGVQRDADEHDEHCSHGALPL
jgi:hypothetical protein